MVEGSYTRYFPALPYKGFQRVSRTSQGPRILRDALETFQGINAAFSMIL